MRRLLELVAKIKMAALDLPHQAEALDDTFELDVFSPIRQDWVDIADEPGTEP